MVDIHSHIMPYVDDGSHSIDESFEMLKIASYANTDTIVLTPHSNLYANDKNLLFEMKSVFDAFSQKVLEQGIDIKICLGGEIFCDENVVRLANQKLLPTINSSRFMLVEFDFYAPCEYITNILKQLSGLGYVSIVAHPERYECIKKHINSALEFMNCGALLQINKGSFVGDFGVGARDTAFELVHRRLCQFIASDAHSSHSRNTDMELTFDIIRDEFGDKIAQRLFDINPRSVVNNGKLVISRPIV